MKFEQLKTFLVFIVDQYLFIIYWLNLSLNNIVLFYFFCWKIANYGDTYWFLFDNKKSIYEIRYVKTA